jgi:hypothetical protein
MAAKDEDIGGVAQRGAGLVSANKLEIVEGYPGKEKEEEKKKGVIQKPTDDGVVKDPELYAKARAKQSMFSGSGRVITPGKDGNDRFQGRYQMGRFAGKTPEEADEIFERTWENATPAQREVYAKKADPGAGMAPSERAKQLKLQRDKEAKEKKAAEKKAAEKPATEKKATEKKAEEVPEEKSTTFNENGGDSMGFDSMGKIHAIGSGETENGSYVGATPEQQAAARAEADKKSESEQTRAKEIEADRVSNLPVALEKQNDSSPMGRQASTSTPGNPIEKPADKPIEQKGTGMIKPVEEKSPIRKAWEATKNVVGGVVEESGNAVMKTITSPFMAPSVSAQIDRKMKDDLLAKQMKYQEGVQQQQQAVAQNTAQITGQPIVKPTPAPAVAVAPTPVAAATAPPFVGPPAPAAPAAPAAVAKPARTYDFESGEGKELTGIVNGRKTYTKAAELYGPAKPSIPNTIAATPATADATKPVMIQGQSIDQQRADHQARKQNVAAADRAMSSTTAVSPIAQKVPSRPAIPRGPASQPIQTSYKRNDPTVDQGAVDKYLSAVKDSHNYGGTDEEYNRRKAAPEEISKASNEVTRLKMGGALALQGTAIDKPVIQKPTATQPVSQRVVATRPPQGMDSMRPGALNKLRSEFAMVSR